MPPSSPLPIYRLAIVVSHPIQYYAPWFRHLAKQPWLDLQVFHLWDFGVAPRQDPGFGHAVVWDVDLLGGYDHVFVPNLSADPGTHHFRGLDNPTLPEVLEAWRPDAILLFGYAYLSMLRVLGSRRLRAIPKLLRGDSHDLARPPGWRTRAGRLGRRLLFRRFAGFLAVGKANTEHYLSSGVPGQRIHFAPHAVDLERFDGADPALHEEAEGWRRSLGIPADAPVALFAGKFEDIKRPMDLLEAFLGLHEGAVEAPSGSPVLLFVGSGAWESKLRKAAGARVGRSVLFAPFQNQSLMPRTYAAADLLVLPSARETWGLVVNEAMAMGRPALVSDAVGCAPDLVEPGVTGWTFPAGDRGALASALAVAFALGRKGLGAMAPACQARAGAYSFEAATEGLRRSLESCAPGTDPASGSPA